MSSSLRATVVKLITKPRLLIILNRFVIGGQAVDTIPLAYYLQKDFEILLLYGEKEKDEIQPSFLLQKYPGLQLLKVSRLRRSINPITDILAFLTIFKIIRSFRADIVHTHGAKSGFLGRLAAFICGVPVIVHTFHGHFFHSYFSGIVSKIIAFVERMMTNITTCAVALSDTQKHELVKVFKIIKAEKLEIIPLGFDINPNEVSNEYRRAFRDRYSVSDEQIAIGIVGRIVPVKNHQLFIRVVQKILSLNLEKQVAFFIIGDGDQRTDVESAFTKLNIPFNSTHISNSNKIVFTSWLTSMEEIMTGLDIIALTSLNEGTPLTLIEAQFFGRPVICTDVGGVKDTMQDGITGFLVGSENDNAFTEKLLSLIKNDELRKEMGRAGRNFVTERYSKKAEIDATKNFYFSLLQKKNILFKYQIEA